MSEDNSRHLPPEALDDWMEKVAELLGIDEEIDIGAVLDLTRDIAHDVARPAAPLTTFALGLALGRQPGEEFSSRFAEWQKELTELGARQGL